MQSFPASRALGRSHGDFDSVNAISTNRALLQSGVYYRLEHCISDVANDIYVNL